LVSQTEKKERVFLGLVKIRTLRCEVIKVLKLGDWVDKANQAQPSACNRGGKLRKCGEHGIQVGLYYNL